MISDSTYHSKHQIIIPDILNPSHKITKKLSDESQSTPFYCFVPYGTLKIYFFFLLFFAGVLRLFYIPIQYTFWSSVVQHIILNTKSLPDIVNAPRKNNQKLTSKSQRTPFTVFVPYTEPRYKEDRVPRDNELRFILGWCRKKRFISDEEEIAFDLVTC